MDHEWILWIAVLVAWPLVGIGMAFLFTHIVRGARDPEDSTLPLATSHTGRERRASAPLSTTTQIRIRRIAGLRDRH